MTKRNALTRACGASLATAFLAFASPMAEGQDARDLFMKPLVPQAGTEQYRFTYAPSFDHLLVVLVMKNRDGATLRAARIKQGVDGVSDPKIIEGRVTEITLRDWNKISELADSSRFWQLQQETGPGGFDGDTWIIDGSRENLVHSVSRWEPENPARRNQLGKFISFARYLTKLSGFSLTERSQEN